MPEDTAVAEAPNAVDEQEQITSPPPESEAETPVESPETVEAEETPETEQEPEWTPPSTQEELDALLEARAKDADAKARESERRKYEDQKAKDLQAAQEAAYKASQEQAAAVRQAGLQQNLDSLANSLAQFITQSEEFREEGKVPSNISVHPEWVQRIFNEMDASLFMSHYEVRKRNHDAWLAQEFPDFRPSNELVSSREAAYASGDYAKVLSSEYEQMREALMGELTPKLREEVRAELAEESKAAEAEESATKRRSAAKPTNVAGGQPPSKPDYSAILANPESSEEEKNKAFEAKHGFANR